MSTVRPRTVSGMRPTGPLHLGHYFGVLKNWVELQHSEEAYFFVADWHALTSDYADPSNIATNVEEMVKDWVAAGLDPEKCVIFRQSAVKEHAELSLLLSMITPVSWLERNPTYKEQQQQITNKDLGNAGFLCYPVLMAADILLYQTDLVPVGGDQKQHVEICRDIAMRFNNIYGDVFTIPEPYIPPTGARIMSLTSPENKMSKSDKDPGGCIYIMQSPDDIMRCFKRAVTDSETGHCVYACPEKLGVTNLMQIYSVCTGKTMDEIEAEFDGMGYGAFKPAVGEAVVETLRPIREEAERLMKDKAYLEDILRDGAERAAYAANRTLRKVYKKIGFVQI